MASIGWAVLLLLCLVQQLHPLAASVSHSHGHLTHHPTPSLLCRPDQASALLKLKQSFIFSPTAEYDLDPITTLPSWQAGTDCCLWEGISCSNSSGYVTALDLSGFSLNSNGIDPMLFNLTSLKLLDLSMNNFRNYYIPSVGFERLSLLTHLNLSTSGIRGQVPIGISKLKNLVSLDLSNRYIYIEDGLAIHAGPQNELLVPDFRTLVANLSNLRELYLDYAVSISSMAQDCFKALAKYVPHLWVLSLEGCGLQGHIDGSLSRLHSLVVIDLSYNYGITPGPFPEFFMNFLNLRVLQLSTINLEGWFPHGMFQSKILKVLDLSWNPNLSGHMPKFSNATSLETLRIDMTNLSYVKSSCFGNFKALAELSLDGKIISMDFLSSFGMLSSLRELSLTGPGSSRELESISSWSEGIKNLRTLYLSNFELSMMIPSSIVNLKNLQGLLIFGSNLTTQTLSAIANINSLKFFMIGDCGCLLEQLPSAIGNMTDLETLEIFNCQLSGPIPHEVGKMKKLKTLAVSWTALSGRIPSSIANLTRLTELVLYQNYLIGEIPTAIFTLPTLQYLDLSENQLSGPIQNFDGVSSCLKGVYLQNNNLTGQIPQALMVLPNLTDLILYGNHLMGSVDLASLWRLENLTYLDLSQNKLTVMEGEDSNSSFIYPSQLMKVRLVGCNMAKIPNLLMRLNHLASLDLSSNNISGVIPNWIWERWHCSLRSLNLSHNMFTGIELNPYVIPISNTLVGLDLSSNKLHGNIPMPEFSAKLLDYSNNAFSSLLPNFTLYLSSTQYLRLSNNSISGHLPQSICHSRLQVLDLSYNNFSGRVPPCLMENGFLRVINLRENQFKGMLPYTMSSECSVQTIDLHGNKIEGQLPRALYNCTRLEVLDLGRNQIVDTFPSWLGRLFNLRVLVLRSNQFHGLIDYLEDEKSGEHFSSLQILDLASNNFSGNLHSQWFEKLKSMKKYNSTGQIILHPNLTTFGFYQDSVTISYKGLFMTFERILTTLTAIDMSDNALEGTIPTSVGNLVSLHVLNMSNNAFTGEIPPQLGNIAALESLDLSSNMLSGEIPQELTNLDFLGTLNLSNNQLDGRIPQSGQFATFQNSSFDGNAGLCGVPLSKLCGSLPDTPSKADMKSSSHGVDVILFLFAGVGFGVGFAAAILMELNWFVIEKIVFEICT
ncbi:hypothetical protein U9M48_025840 [Paspalum notatum var. saurae]|uniref:Leucine-rich repeat-containing N-terminal plant-type domain-containing protein n=1 Tax=Paspalum notatum var. saurae TaxID=547442 RepID=A0AAQ3TQZ7_PASNO